MGRSRGLSLLQALHGTAPDEDQRVPLVARGAQGRSRSRAAAEIAAPVARPVPEFLVRHPSPQITVELGSESGPDPASAAVGSHRAPGPSSSRSRAAHSFTRSPWPARAIGSNTNWPTRAVGHALAAEIEIATACLPENPRLRRRRALSCRSLARRADPLDLFERGGPDLPRSGHPRARCARPASRFSSRASNFHRNFNVPLQRKILDPVRRGMTLVVLAQDYAPGRYTLDWLPKPLEVESRRESRPFDPAGALGLSRIDG